jgi:hypothetical protein
MKKLLFLLILLALVPTHLRAFDSTYYRSLAAMPLAVDACSRSGQIPEDQLGRFASRLNEADVPPPMFVETIRYAPVALQQPDFIPFVDSEYSQGVTGAALITVINERLPRYGVTVRRIETTPSWVLSDNYIPRYGSYTTRRTTRTVRYDPGYDARYYLSRPRYDRRTMLFLIEMPLAVATVSDFGGIRQDDLGRFCGTLNRGYLPPEQFIDTVRYAPAVFVERPDFVPYLDVQIGNGVIGLRLFDVIHQQLPSYVSPSVTYSPGYVLTDQYIPQTVRTQFAQARLNPAGGYTQPSYVPQPAAVQPVYTQQPVAQQSYARQHGGGKGRQQAIAQSPYVPQPAIAQNQYVAPAQQVVRIPPGQAKKAARNAEVQAARQQGQGNGNGRGHAVQQQQPVVAAPPPMASAAPAPAPPAVVPAPAQDNGKAHGRGPGGEGPPGQQKEKGGKGHGKD